MGTLKSFLDSKGITEQQLVTVSRRIETNDEPTRALLVKRAGKRRGKETATKKYAELDIAKPKTLGRGVSHQQLSAAVNDRPVSKRVRTKILRAVNTVLGSKKDAAAEMKTIFEGVTARAGKKPKDEKKA